MSDGQGGAALAVREGPDALAAADPQAPVPGGVEQATVLGGAEGAGVHGGAAAGAAAAGEEALFAALAGFIKEVNAPDLTDGWSAERLARDACFNPRVKNCAMACFPGEPLVDNRASARNNPLLVAFCARRFPAGGAALAARDSPDALAAADSNT